MHTFLIVGRNFSGLRSKITENGDDYILLQDKDATKYPNKRFKRRVLGDFSSKETLLTSVLPLKGEVDGIVCMYENYVLASSWVSEALGLPGLPTEAAEACTDKYVMRQHFAKSPHKISVDFMEVQTESDLKVFAKNHNFPLILKPANLAKSLLITKCHDYEELVKYYHATLQTIDQIYRKYAPNRTPKIVVEEFMQGPVHSVDAFVDSHGTPHVLDSIVDYQTGYDVGYDDNFHYSRLLPTKLGATDQARLIHCAEEGIRALGMQNSPAHVEIIMTVAGPKIVEIGARNGGYRERMHRLANNLDLLNNTLQLALGRQPSVVVSQRQPCAVLELFPKDSGEFTGISHEHELNQLPSLVYFSTKPKPGQHIGKSSQGFKAAAVIMLHHGNLGQFQKDLDYVNNNVFVLTS